MPLLKTKENDEEKERQFTIESQRKMSTEERFHMLFEKAKVTREILQSYGHTPPPQIIKRTKG